MRARGRTASAARRSESLTAISPAASRYIRRSSGRVSACSRWCAASSGRGTSDPRSERTYGMPRRRRSRHAAGPPGIPKNAQTTVGFISSASRRAAGMLRRMNESSSIGVHSSGFFRRTRRRWIATPSLCSRSGSPGKSEERMATECPRPRQAPRDVQRRAPASAADRGKFVADEEHPHAPRTPLPECSGKPSRR